jgi:hypothetical protein
MVTNAASESDFLSHLVIIGPLASGSDHWAWAEESADSWGVAV